jgi:hypothetical protein
LVISNCIATTAGTHRRTSAPAVLENASKAPPRPVSQALSTTSRSV